MSEQAKRRIQAIGQQLNAGSSDSSSTSLPPIAKVAAGSSSPRVQGKVVIITGNQPLPISRLTVGI